MISVYSNVFSFYVYNVDVSQFIWNIKPFSLLLEDATCNSYHSEVYFNAVNEEWPIFQNNLWILYHNIKLWN